MTLRALIVDDEPPARRKIRALLKGDSRFEIVGEAENGLKAVESIEAEHPDIVFLDIQMPGLSGFEVLEALGAECPQIIFTTAFDQYAVKAFAIHAVDYLLKPFDVGRFQESLERAIQERRFRGLSAARVEALVNDWQTRQGPLDRILIRYRNRLKILNTKDIEWIEAEEKYVRLHLQRESFLHRDTMVNLELRLDPKRFIRIHRRQIVNLNFVKELAPWAHGDYQIMLADGGRLPLGRKYRKHFLELFK